MLANRLSALFVMRITFGVCSVDSFIKKLRHVVKIRSVMTMGSQDPADGSQFILQMVEKERRIISHADTAAVWFWRRRGR